MKELLFFLACLQGSLVQAQTSPPDSPWKVDELFQTPEIHLTDECKLPGFRSFFYEGLEYKSRPAYVFAYYKAPEGVAPAGGWPAVLCIHGGGGTAFPEWIQAWVDKGYAAMAIDTDGHLPVGNFPDRPWHINAGPTRITTFGDIEIANREQWFYHAVADAVRGNSLLRSFPEINKDKIGIHGISWGGVIVSAAIGLDNRFAFAVPVYGCGFLHENTVPNFKRYFDVMTPAQLSAYKNKWDPSNYLSNCTVPMLWYTGSNDGSFSLDVWQKSAMLTRGPKMLCIPVTAEHGHYWNQKEIFAFANAIVNNNPLMQIGAVQLKNNMATVNVSGRKAKICKALFNKRYRAFSEQEMECNRCEAA